MATVAAQESSADGASEGPRDELAMLKEENRTLRQTLLAAQTEASRKHADLLKFVSVCVCAPYIHSFLLSYFHTDNWRMLKQGLRGMSLSLSSNGATRCFPTPHSKYIC